MLRAAFRTTKPLRLIALVGFIGVSILLINGLVTYGQELLSKQGLELTPPSQEIQADPGKTVLVKVKIRNPSSQALPITVRVEDFTAEGDEGQVALVNKSKYTVTKWTTITPSKFTLSPKGERDVTATITVPAGAAGGRYGALVFGVTPDLSNQDAKNVATVSQEIASLFLLKIKGPIQEELTLQKIQAPAFSEFGPIELQMFLTNSGNIHSKTTGLIHITNIFGHTTADIVVKPTNVFPGANRVVGVVFDKGLLFGPYKATAALYYGSENRVMNASTSFIVFPVRVIALLLVIGGVLYAGRKRIKKAGKALFS